MSYRIPLKPRLKNMKWSSLKKIYAGIVGNALFFLSLLAIVSSVPLIKLSNLNISIQAIGALFISTSYIIQKIKTPFIIDYFGNYIEYYNYIFKLNNEKSLDFEDEFSLLENGNTAKLPIFKEKEYKLREFKSIADSKKIMGDNISLYYFCILKYSALDFSLNILRYYLTLSFLVGLFLLYFPTVERLFDIIIGGLNG